MCFSADAPLTTNSLLESIAGMLSDVVEPGPVIRPRVAAYVGCCPASATVGHLTERAAEPCRRARLQGVERPHARLPGTCPAVPALGDALNAGYRYLEVKCLGCEPHQTVALDIVRQPKWTPVHELERYMRCQQCSRLNGHLFKRSHLVALRTNKISASNPLSTWWPGER
ncbi:hypothetical protein SAMN05444164_3679 [Bradyrhizobium erythrophlei]|uniref:Uncharacterized protein n=1 Tax=Bradyrhizobium erythrophlei TaxID=1437360 RepID=A0A1H4XX30_9BRAD|nr:hypothetical protein SAMN05444164_3679 [Bradyrhizobium erythrophlei]